MTAEILKGLAQHISRLREHEPTEHNLAEIAELEHAFNRLPLLPEPLQAKEDLAFWLRWANRRLCELQTEVRLGASYYGSELPAGCHGAF